MAQTPEKDTARPRFFMDAIQNMAKSQAEGRPIFDEKEMVEIHIPGDKLYSHVTQVHEVWRHIGGQPVTYAQRWPNEYAAFKRGEERAASGTPLEHWPNPAMTKARVAEIKAQNILSLEELAGVPDSTLPKLGMGARELRDMAKAYIDEAKANAPMAAMAAEISQLKEMLARLGGGQPAQSVPSPLTVGPLVQAEKPIEQCTDGELKEYIKKKTGQAPKGRIGRDTLLKRVAELATAA